MNEQLQEFARRSLLDGLAKLPDGCHEKFKLMYGRDNGKRSAEDAKLLSIDEVVSEMPADKLDWAMAQVGNTLKKLGEM